jgi:ureidomalonase
MSEAERNIGNAKKGPIFSRRAMLAGSGAVITGLMLDGKGHLASSQSRAAVKGNEIVMMDAMDLSRAIARRDVSCVDVMKSYLEHIHRVNPQVNAIIALAKDEDLLKEAEQRDQQLARGEYLGWMHGFPQAIKELASAKGFPATSGSPIFKDRIAESDSLFVARIKAAGGIVIGKTNSPEFGLGSQTYNPVWGTTGNAYDPSKTSGGSSGGAASALALRMLPVADGSDYMGSLRNPAAFNNVLGFRPTWGRIPANGFIAQAAVAGPMGRSVADVAALLSVMAGPSPSAALDIEEDPSIFRQPLERDFRGARIAWVGDYKGYLATEPGILDLCQKSFAAFESLGASVEEVLPDYPMAELFETFMTWRGFAQLGNYKLWSDPATKAMMKPELQWEMERAVKLSALDISRADAQRNAWYAVVVKLFENYDYILAPSAQVFPFDKNVHWPSEIAGRKMDTYHRWMETVAPWSLTDLPIMGMPVGFNDAGLPAGIQLIGKDNDDLGVLQMAYAYEQVTGWVHKKLPPLLKTA